MRFHQKKGLNLSDYIVSNKKCEICDVYTTTHGEINVTLCKLHILIEIEIQDKII